MQEKNPGPAWRIKVGPLGGKVGVRSMEGRRGGRAWEANGMDFQPVGRSFRGVPSVPSGSCSPIPAGSGKVLEESTSSRGRSPVSSEGRARNTLRGARRRAC